MNNIELYIARAFLESKELYDQYSPYVEEISRSEKSLIKEIFAYIRRINLDSEKRVLFYEADVDKKEILFFSERINKKEADNELLSAIWKRIKEIPFSSNDEEIKGILSQYKHKKLCEQIAIISLDVAEGKKPNSVLLDAVKGLESSEETLSIDEEKSPFVDKSLSELLDSQIGDDGLNWRLKCLRQSLGPLRKGDFGFLFARPETGKTTFLTSEISFFLDQVSPDHPILWFNNEEQGEKVYIRLYQALYNLTLDELRSKIHEVEKHFEENYRKRFWLYDDASISTRNVSSILDSYQPSLIIFDQLDKIKGFKEDRQDIELGELYIWAREIAKKYCPVIGVCQAGATAHNKQWIDMNDVVNAKTSKQAEADWLLGIGATEHGGNIRFLNIPKNKLVGGSECLPEYRHGKLNALIIPERARYEDI